jgi:hypothetical protein
LVARARGDLGVLDGPPPRPLGINTLALLLFGLWVLVVALDAVVGYGMASVGVQNRQWIAAIVAALLALAGPIVFFVAWYTAPERGQSVIDRLGFATKLGLLGAILPTLVSFGWLYVLSRSLL